MRTALACGIALCLCGSRLVAAPATRPASRPTPTVVVPEWAGGQGKFVTAVAVGAGSVFVATEDGGLWASVAGKDWDRIGPADGRDPPGDAPRSLAVDGRGRLWVGYGRHGVAVRDGGGHWKVYDAPAGPLGHRVWRIAVSPVDGDVWLATDLGLARYAAATDRWSYVLAAGSLPSDQVESLAFAADGTLYAGTSCDGLAVGSPADGYAAWRVVTGPDRAGVEAAGPGLPSGAVNDVSVGADGTVFVATNGGLGVGRDHGQRFAFARGAEYADKAQDRVPADAPSAKPDPGSSPLVVEDHVTRVSRTAAGHLLVGGWRLGWQLLDADTLRPVPVAEPQGPAAARGHKSFVTAFLPAAAGDGYLVGTYGDGLIACPTTGPVTVAAVPGDAAAPLPSEAGARGKSLAAVRSAVAAARGGPVVAAYLGTDYVTAGDAFARYGALGADANQLVHYGAMGDNQPFGVTVGPHTRSGGPYYELTAPSTGPGDRLLYLPALGIRRCSEWNDGTFRNTAEATFEGADLWVSVNGPPDAGLYRLSLYFFNNDGRRADPRRRDYTVEVKDGTQPVAEANFAPALARCRVHDFYDPVLARFLIRGGKPYLVKVARNYSSVAKLSAVFLDRVTDADGNPATPTLCADAPMDPAHWGPPPPPPARDNRGPAATAAAVWDELDRHWDDDGVVRLQQPLRLLAYRQAAAAGADPTLLEHWRWHLGLWTDADRLACARQMDASYDWAVANGRAKAAPDGKRMTQVDRFKRDHPNDPTSAPATRP